MRVMPSNFNYKSLLDSFTKFTELYQTQRKVFALNKKHINSETSCICTKQIKTIAVQSEELPPHQLFTS